jgi:tight adherence protein B
MTPLLLGALAGAVVLLLLPSAIPRRSRSGWPPVRSAPGRVRRAAGVDAEWVESLVAELRAGHDPSAALLAAAAATPGAAVSGAVAAARGGGDVALALHADSEVAAEPLLRAVAACWDVAAGSGAGLADSLTTLADSAREAERVRRELRAGLAEPRATALVLAALPVVGLGLGVLLGADPLAWLVATSVGRAVLIAGLLIEAAGAWWAWRIIAGLEASL